MGKIGNRKMTRSFALWSLGGALLLIVGISVLKNLPEGKLSPDNGVTISAKPQTKSSDRKTSNKHPLVQTHHSSMSEKMEVTASEERISQIVGSGRPVHDIAAELLELFPESKGSEQVLLASHLSHLAEGEQVDELVSYLSDPRINKRAKEEIFNSIYECEPKQTAALLIQVIDDGVQEYASEAEHGLSILLQADHGMDVAAWKSELNNHDEFLDPK